MGRSFGDVEERVLDIDYLHVPYARQSRGGIRPEARPCSLFLSSQVIEQTTTSSRVHIPTIEGSWALDS